MNEPEQLTLDSALKVQTCTCDRHATCPRCDPDYVEQDGDWAAGIVTHADGLKPRYGVIPYRPVAL